MQFVPIGLQAKGGCRPKIRYQETFMLLVPGAKC